MCVLLKFFEGLLKIVNLKIKKQIFYVLENLVIKQIYSILARRFVVFMTISSAEFFYLDILFCVKK